MKPTGPGKVATSITPPGAPVQGSVGLLFNFDFDGTTVKPEHQAFLVAHFVPPLKTARDLRLFLRGTASQVGDAAYNLQLSRRRVEAVRNFVLSQAVRPEQVVATFTGENLSTSTIPDDERDRAVEAILEASTAPPRFDRVVPVETLDGFHAGNNPQRLVMATQERSFVRLLGARGSIVESLTPGVVQARDPFRPGMSPVLATSDNMLLELDPGMPGRAQVVTRLPAQTARVPNSARLSLFNPIQSSDSAPPAAPTASAARLDVAAVIFKRVKVTFHYVIGPSGSIGVTTGRQPDARVEQSLIGVMNSIYLRQARILFESSSSRVVKTDFMGPINVATDKIIVSSAHTTNIDETARIRIFFVGNIDDPRDVLAHTPQRPGASFVFRDFIRPLAQKPILFTDTAAVGITLAHESGHCFGIPDLTNVDPKLLMHEKNTGVTILQEHAVVMHRNIAIP